MAKFALIIFGIIIVNCSLTLAKARQFDDIQIGQGLISTSVTSESLSKNVYGRLLSGLYFGSENVVCSLIGPDFLQTVVNNNNCPSGIILPTVFHSYRDFCAFYNDACESTKKCLIDSAIQIKLDMDGIIKFRLVFARCCADCTGRKSLTTSEAENKAIEAHGGNGIGHVYISTYGLIGNLITAPSDAANRLVCTFIGPNFLQAILNTNECPREIYLPTIFHSYRDFCAFYNSACPSTKKCLTDAAARIKIDEYGIINEQTTIGRCCARCATRKDASQ